MVGFFNRKSLLARLAGGSRRAAEEFFDLYHDPLYRFCFYRLGGRHHDAEEVVSATLAEALRSIASFRGEADPFDWLAGIARHKVADHHRKGAVRRRMETALPEADPELSAALEKVLEMADPPEEILAQAEFREVVQACLHSLRPAFHEALRLRFWEGLSVEEMGRRMGVTAKAAEHVLARARAAFGETFKIVAGEFLS